GSAESLPGAPVSLDGQPGRPLVAAPEGHAGRVRRRGRLGGVARRRSEREAGMTDRIHDTRRGPRVGFFGLLGSGNLGNDGSLDAFLAYLHKEYPDAEVDFLCAGPDQIVARYGLPA